MNLKEGNNECEITNINEKVDFNQYERLRERLKENHYDIKENKATINNILFCVILKRCFALNLKHFVSFLYYFYSLAHFGFSQCFQHYKFN